MVCIIVKQESLFLLDDVLVAFCGDLSHHTQNYSGANKPSRANPEVPSSICNHLKAAKIRRKCLLLICIIKASLVDKN